MRFSRLPLLLLSLAPTPASTQVSPGAHEDVLPKSPSEVHECDVVKPIEAPSGPELVAEHRSEFGTSSIWRTAGHLQLVINEVLMSDTRDEHIYHETLVLPALLTAERPPQKVLVIGGGEGATLREVLRDARVENATMVDIDEGTVRLCREHLAAMHRGSFDDPRAHIVFGDGRAFIRAAAGEEYDVVVVDGVDFESCGEHSIHGNGLYSSDFYKDLARILKPGGVLAQYMSEVFRADEMLDAGFADVLHLLVEVPSFGGGGARFALAAKASVPKRAEEGTGVALQRRLQSGVELRYPSAGWSYLSPQAVAESLARANDSELILQKGGSSHSSYGHSTRSTGYSTRSTSYSDRRRSYSAASNYDRRRSYNAGSYGDRSRYSSGGYIPPVIIVHRTGSPFWGTERCFNAENRVVPCDQHRGGLSRTMVVLVVCLCVFAVVVPAMFFLFRCAGPAVEPHVYGTEMRRF